MIKYINRYSEGKAILMVFNSGSLIYNVLESKHGGFNCESVNTGKATHFNSIPACKNYIETVAIL